MRQIRCRFLWVSNFLFHLQTGSVNPEACTDCKLFLSLHSLLASDCHLGYMEKDQVRGNDSLVTFEEILQIAKDKTVSLY